MQYDKNASLDGLSKGTFSPIEGNDDMRPINQNDSFSKRLPVFQKSRKGQATRVLLVALCSLSVLLSCNLPTIQFEQVQAPTATTTVQEFTATATIEQEEIIQETLVPTATAIPPSGIESGNDTINSFAVLGIDSEYVLVYIQPDGTLVFQRSDNTINKVNISLDLDFDELMNQAHGKISFPAGKSAGFSNRDDFKGLIRTDDSGVLEKIPLPDATGEPLGALPSPDGSQIIWLFDDGVHSNPSDSTGCSSESDCLAYLYHLVLTDGDGSNPRTILSYEGATDDTDYQLQLYQWKSDGNAIFLRWEFHDTTMIYPATGGGIIEVTVPGGKTKVWKEDWYTDSIINADGNMLATTNDHENGYALRLSEEYAEIATLPLEANHLISQLTFSPDNTRLLWIDYVQGDDMALTRLSLKTMNIASQDSSILMDFDIPEPTGIDYSVDLPYIGAWLTDDLLVINYRSGSRLLNTRNGEWLTNLELPESTQPLYLLDSILPSKNTTTTLSDDGPWLVMRAKNGFLWAVNEDGTGLTQLTNLPMVAPSLLSSAVSPDGTSLAYITSTDPDRNANLTLNLLSLPDGQNEVITVLTSPESEPDEALWEGNSAEAVGDKSYEATRAILTGNAVAWSPDGRTLAFVGAQNGPSSDLFTYTLADKNFARMSSGPSQAYNPSWSPDGKYIVHFGASSFGDGTKYDMVGVWVSAADIVGSKELYDPSKTGSGEELVGWLDDETFVVYSIVDCPGRDLRLVNINSGLIRMLYNDCFYQANISPDGTLAVVNEQDLVDQPGLYLLSAQQSDLIYISEGAGKVISYSQEAGVFLVQSSAEPPSIHSFATDGSPGAFEGIGDFPFLSSDGNYWAWNETGGSNKILLKGINNEFIIPLTASPGYYPVWNRADDQEEQRLFFFSSNKKEDHLLNLYMAASPDFIPQPIMEKLTPATVPEWMIPK